MSENLLRSALDQGTFIYTAELVLGRDHVVAEAERFVREASAAADGVKVISVTDLPGGHPALPPEALIPYILEHGLTPVAHLTGKDGNRAFLEARLRAFARMGVENILALTGDAQKAAFAGSGKPVHDLDSVLILSLIRAMRDGMVYKVGSRTIESAPFDFFPAAVVNPYKVREPDLMMQLYKLELKIRAGAGFIITQLGFNLRKLYEIRQYMIREGLDGVPTLANIYVPTAGIARLMHDGELAGCVVSHALLRRLEAEKKPERMRRAALMLAAAKDLGFAGAHIGGFGLSHRDVMTIMESAQAIGVAWRKSIDELIFAYPDEFYLFPSAGDGLSDGSGEYQSGRIKARPTWNQRFSRFIHRGLISLDSPAARFFASRLRAGEGDSWRRGVWYALLKPSTVYRKAALGCADCGDCVQDHLAYAGCSMRRCYKELRNGPCGGSRVDGTCEAHPELPCIWNMVYRNTRAAGEDPRKFARLLVPPRDWALDRTNALANRLAGLDNASKRTDL